jgi:hypothetical protein
MQAKPEIYADGIGRKCKNFIRRDRGTFLTEVTNGCMGRNIVRDSRFRRRNAGDAPFSRA